MNKFQTDQIPAVFAYLDAEKAFDRTERRYLKRVIMEFGVGPYYCKWLDLLYDDHGRI